METSVKLACVLGVVCCAVAFVLCCALVYTKCEDKSEPVKAYYYVFDRDTLSGIASIFYKDRYPELPKPGEFFTVKTETNIPEFETRFKCVAAYRQGNVYIIHVDMKAKEMY